MYTADTDVCPPLPWFLSEACADRQYGAKKAMQFTLRCTLTLSPNTLLPGCAISSFTFQTARVHIRKEAEEKLPLPSTEIRVFTTQKEAFC